MTYHQNVKQFSWLIDERMGRNDMAADAVTGRVRAVHRGMSDGATTALHAGLTLVVPDPWGVWRTTLNQPFQPVAGRPGLVAEAKSR